eukprot:TRINITY_DN63348_c0_g1_i1.p1 TRINITY_DN63348_c0_g1~~TRINITY_DN63348_c0_g1_i1.p1  ORF type:complete len:421 (-),score=80.12 TRINITY_DN63348_c0_g1_i1:82-1344(-)
MLSVSSRWLSRPFRHVLALTPRQGRALSMPAASQGRFQLSEERLQQFLQAEVHFFAEQQSNSITLREVLDASKPELAARLMQQELPPRFAQRIMQIEALPGWETSEDLKVIHDYYFQSFRAVRLIELPTGDNYDEITKNVQELKGRMKGVVPRLARAMRELRETQDFQEAWINEWLDTFLLSRIGTEMLTSQYMACVDEGQQSAKRRKRKGIVDDVCDPTRICEQAGSHARRLCRQHFRTAHDVRIIVESTGDSGEMQLGSWGQDAPRIQFPYVPQYLFYIMLELLKNSARATVENCHEKDQLRERPIVITVVADASQVVIRVDDMAGGIPFSVADRVWSYMYTTAGKGESAFPQEGTPLAGYGVGLPLSRLYARYLGGSLKLMSLPGIGTSAYLNLKRLETEAREELPMSSVSSVEVPI